MPCAALDRPGWAVEGREEAVSGGLYLVSPIALQLLADDAVMLVQQLPASRRRPSRAAVSVDSTMSVNRIVVSIRRSRRPRPERRRGTSPPPGRTASLVAGPHQVIAAGQLDELRSWDALCELPSLVHRDDEVVRRGAARASARGPRAETLPSRAAYPICINTRAEPGLTLERASRRIARSSSPRP